MHPVEASSQYTTIWGETMPWEATALLPPRRVLRSQAGRRARPAPRRQGWSALALAGTALALAGTAVALAALSTLWLGGVLPLH